jgi:hypothetical protein
LSVSGFYPVKARQEWLQREWALTLKLAKAGKIEQ